MSIFEKQFIAELLADYYFDQWEKLTPGQQQLVVCDVETRADEDGLTIAQAVRELNHFHVKGELVKYVVEKLQVCDVFERIGCPPKRT